MSANEPAKDLNGPLKNAINHVFMPPKLFKVAHVSNEDDMWLVESLHDSLGECELGASVGGSYHASYRNAGASTQSDVRVKGSQNDSDSNRERHIDSSGWRYIHST